MESTFVLHGIKSAQFLSPPDFYSGPPKEEGLTKNPGDPWAKFSQPINFNYELLYF
jgi:hypothetical protein